MLRSLDTVKSLTPKSSLVLLVACAYLMLSAGDAHAYSGSHLWSAGYGAAGEQIGESVAVDAAGNVFIAGNFENIIDFGGGALTANGAPDIFIAKLSPTGSHVWSDSYGGVSDQAVRDMIADASGDVIVAGSFNGSVDFGGGNLVAIGDRDAYLAKFDGSGNHAWSMRFGDGGLQEAFAVDADAAGNVLVAGSFSGTIDLGGDVLTAVDDDIFVAKFDSAGTHLWSKRFGGTGGQYALAAALDPASNAVMTGMFDLSVDFGGGALADADGAFNAFTDGFAVKLDGAGAHIWSKRFGDAGQQAGTAIGADVAGNAIMAGTFQGSVDFGGGPLAAGSGANNVYLAKLDASGSHVWSKEFGATLAYAHDAAVDASGNVLLTGYFAIGYINFGGGAFFTNHTGDGYLAKFDPSGNHTWTRAFGDYPGTQMGNGVDTGPGDHVYLTGYFESAANFAWSGEPLVAEDGDAFLAKFDGAPPTDVDADGCTDAEELGHYTPLGGLRDPSSPWDFYDVNSTKKIDAIDIALVRAKFDQDFPPYDRSQGLYPWAPGAPDGIVNATDIGLVRASFGHSCQALPN